MQGKPSGMIDPDWGRVADSVRSRMASLVIDQAELVRRSGLSDPFVRAIMRGEPRGNPRPANLARLAVALGWTPDSIDRLLDGDDPTEVEISQRDDVEYRLERLERAVLVLAKSMKRDDSSMFDRLDRVVADLESQLAAQTRAR